MNPAAVQGSPLLAKTHAFFVPESAAMQAVPDHRAKKAKDVSDYSGDNDEGNRSHQIEWFNEVHRLDHVRPENEIEDRLRQAKQNQERPNEMPSTDQCADDEPNFIGISHRCSSLTTAFRRPLV